MQENIRATQEEGPDLFPDRLTTVAGHEKTTTACLVAMAMQRGFREDSAAWLAARLREAGHSNTRVGPAAGQEPKWHRATHEES